MVVEYDLSEKEWAAALRLLEAIQEVNPYISLDVVVLIIQDLREKAKDMLPHY